jgi:tetratricopeptide (TPR) repeat protein
MLLAKSSGQIGWSVGLFSLLFLAVFLCVLQQLERYRTASLYLEDALAASNLASAVVDLKEYGKSHKILIGNPDEAYERYRFAVMGNLNLNQEWEGVEGGVVVGIVKIVDYTVYNVTENEVAVSHYDEDGLKTEWKTPLGGAVAPNGVAVTSTSVYSEITFGVKGMFGIQVRARKGNLADIARNL